MLNKKKFFGKALSLSCGIVAVSNTFNVASGVNLVSEEDINKSLKNNFFYNFLSYFNFFGIFSERLSQMKLNESLCLMFESFYGFLVGKNSKGLEFVRYASDCYGNKTCIYNINFSNETIKQINFCFKDDNMSEVHFLEADRKVFVFKIGKNISKSMFHSVEQHLNNIITLALEESKQSQKNISANDCDCNNEDTIDHLVHD